MTLKTHKEYIHFLYIAPGSMAEPDNQIIITKDPKFTGGQNFYEISEKPEILTRYYPV